MTDEQIERFRSAIEELEEQLFEDRARDTGQTPEEIREAVESYPMPDPDDLERIPAEEFYGDS